MKGSHEANRSGQANRSSEATRRRILVVVAIATAAVFAVTKWFDVNSLESSLAQARADGREVDEKLAVISKLNSAPLVASLRLDSPAQITNRIAAALAKSKITPSSLLNEQPLDPQRLDRSDFEIRSTIIELKPNPLPKILAFCDALREADSGTLVSGLVLSDPGMSSGAAAGNRQSRSNRGNQANQADDEVWKAELTLTQVIYSPKSKR